MEKYGTQFGRRVVYPIILPGFLRSKVVVWDFSHQQYHDNPK